MPNIVVFGAGLVAKPLVQYLLEQPDYNVKVATRTVSKAEKMIDGRSNGTALQFDITKPDAGSQLDELIKDTDLAVSLLPYIYHVKVAKACIDHGRNMVTTSYVSEAMQELDAKAKAADIIILNEVGLDPGIDHMSAMRIIHRIQAAGGKVDSFYSYCGGLPAPDANTNYWGYKFSWSPRGVVLAARNSAQYLKEGEKVVVPSEELFTHYWQINIEGLGEFEAYPNRDSLPYLEKYGIQESQSMYRGTLRNLGWCVTMKKIVDLGFLDETERPELIGQTFQQLMRSMIGAVEAEELIPALAKHLNIDEDSEPIKRFEWLGLLSDDPVPAEPPNYLDVLANKLLEKLQYSPGERDMVILHHEFSAVYPDEKEKITSTLIDFGIPNGDSSMARTVGLPCAIGAKMVADGKITVKGVHIPILPEIYEPILNELESKNIVFKEKLITD